MRHRFTGIIRPALALLSLSLVSLAGHAQTASAPTRPAGPFSYDVSQEVALNGTVSVVLAKAAPGMMPGAHLLLLTADGTTDVSLGTASLQGTGVLSLAAGQQVEVVGVTKTFQGKPVFFARSVNAGNHLYLIRNKHG